MGYYSDFNGEYEPARKLSAIETYTIRSWFIQRFGKYAVKDDGGIEYHFNVEGIDKWYDGDIVFDYENNIIRPSSYNMKGYNFNEHLYEFVEWLKTALPDVRFYGVVERTGEEFGDMECIRIEDGKVKSYSASIQWGNPEVCNETEEQKNAKMRLMLKTYMTGGIR